MTSHGDDPRVEPESMRADIEDPEGVRHVEYASGAWSCDCDDFRTHGACRHVRSFSRALGMVRERAVEEWVSSADFKTHCLRLIDEVRQARGEVVVTRYGTPVARLVPYEETSPSPVGHLRGSVTSYGDLVAPVEASWEADA